MSTGLALQATKAVQAAAIGGAAPAASGGLLAGIMGGLGALTGPLGMAAGLLGDMGGSGMFGGGKSSSATSSATFNAGDFVVGSDNTSIWLLIGVIILLVIIMAKGK